MTTAFDCTLDCSLVLTPITNGPLAPAALMGAVRPADPLPDFKRFLTAVLYLVEAGATPPRADLGRAVASLKARLAAARIVLAENPASAVDSALAAVATTQRTPRPRRPAAPGHSGRVNPPDAGCPADL